MGPDRRGFRVLPVGVLLLVAVALAFLDARDLIPALAIQLVTLLFPGGGGHGDRQPSNSELQPLVRQLDETMVRTWEPMRWAVDFDEPRHAVRDRFRRSRGAGAVPPRVRRGGWPDLGGGGRSRRSHLTNAAVDELVTQVLATPRRLVIRGADETGPSTALLALFLAAQGRRDGRPHGPLPLWVSLAGWDPGDGRPMPSLRDWVLAQLNDRYPELFAARAVLRPALETLWQRPGELALFLDDCPDPIAQRAIAGAEGHTVVLACGPGADLGRDHPELLLAPLDPEDVDWFLGPDYPDLERQARRGELSPRRLTLLRELRELGLVEEDRYATTAQPDVRRLLARIWPAPGADGGPAGPDAPGADPAILGTLRWIVARGLLTGAGFAWWQVPQLAEEAARRDPRSSLGAAYRRLLWARARSAARWATAAFAAGLAAIAVLAYLGAIRGFDRTDHGLHPPDRPPYLRWGDVRQWFEATRIGRDPAGWLASVSANPVLLAAAVSLLIAVTVVAMTRYGGELERPRTAGRGETGWPGHPQTIQPTLPGFGDLPAILRRIGRYRAAGLAVAVALAAALPALGLGGPDVWWPGVIYAAVVVTVLGWLTWCIGPAEPVSAGDAIRRERDSSRTVALTVGVTLALTSTTLTWWFTAHGAPPTLAGSIWIAASAAIAVGVARGVHAGAGMGLPWSPMSAGIGLGYARRLDLLQAALPPPGAEDLPYAVLELVDSLDRPAEGGPHPRLLLRQVGTLIRPRDPSFALFDGPEHADQPGADRPRSGPVRRLTSGLVALRAAVLGLVLVVTSSGMAAVEGPRLPCTEWGRVPGRTLAPAPREVWLENGQCVGFVTPDSAQAGFGAPGSPAAGGEALLSRVLAGIAEQNQAVAGSGPEVVTLAFLAPLSRSSPDSVINALNQLDGAAGAQAFLNRGHGGTKVRLVVANSGEDFVAGEAVATALARAFPAGGTGSLRAVVGLSQSRASTLQAMHTLLAANPDLQIVAASVNGDKMQDGGVSRLGAGTEHFVSVAPGDAQVARAMVTHARAGSADGDQRIRVIYDPADTYFSDELAGALFHELGRVADGREDIRLTEGADGATVEAAGAELCRSRRTVWLFAGRGAQLLALGDYVRQARRRDPGACPDPAVIAGPGGLSLMADPDHGGLPLPGDRTTLWPWRRLSFYALTGPTGDPAGAQPPTPAGPPVVDSARRSEYATGYASVLVAVRRLHGSIACRPADAVPFALHFDPAGNGHNDLRADGTDDCSAPEPTPVLFCPAAATGRCLAPDEPQPALRAEPADR